MKRLLFLLLCALSLYSMFGCTAKQNADTDGLQEITLTESADDCTVSAFLFEYSDDHLEKNAEQPYQSITIAFTNRQSEAFSCAGSELILACSRNEKWYQVPLSPAPKANPAQYNVRLDGYSMSTCIYSLTDYYDYLPKGDYWLLFPLESEANKKQPLYVSFTIS